ncbi:SpoIIE family protein phosphatase [Streptomyces sp. SID8379]|uniref:PP2C family protein-serine/threonine phosphatase n=1 Tax=unclassified Streptomyces TaxID=2593676 RepID=UPI00039C9153|nr:MULTISPECIES: fused response regulator/phosphatase [unclassified Streptomyces]MYW67881.1 SpoIIE family protein phosphatase [Streptomyces sp. SID8379]
MPVPVPRQRAIPAVESGQAQAASTTPAAGPARQTAAVRDTTDNTTFTTSTTSPTSTTDNTTAAVVSAAATRTATTATAADTAAGSTTAVGTTTARPATGSTSQNVGPTGSSGSIGSSGSSTGLTLLVLEDDPTGSLTVPEMQDAAGKPIRVRTARNLTEAERLLTHDVNCILLDLTLPATKAGREDADELETLRHVLRLAPRHAVLALTASGDAERGAEAVRVGAQDYLFRDELDGRLLGRAVRYAVERKRADVAQRKLTESRLRAQENARLERGLLPTPLLDGSPLRFASRYRPGRSRALLGGDFYDVVRTPDGTVHAMIGDVCGHGPDEAALGVELRIAWRALTFAGLCGDELLSTLQRVLEHERADDEIFATLCTVDIAPDGRRAGLCLAGHPSPLIASPGRPATLLPYENNGPALGLLPKARWPRMQVELGPEWSLMLYTDGLIEGRVGQGNQRLGQDGMVELIRRRRAQGLHGEELLEAAMNEVRDLNGGDLTDDVAVLLLDR